MCSLLTFYLNGKQQKTFTGAFVLFFQTEDLNRHKRESKGDDCALGKGKFLDFSEINWTWELTLLLWNPKRRFGLPFREGASGFGLLKKFWLGSSHDRVSEFLNASVVLSSLLEGNIHIHN